MLVEFVGLPGAGKSTVAHALAQSLRARGEVVAEPTFDLDHRSSPVRRMAAKARHALSFVLHHPTDAAWSAKIVARSGQPTPRDLGLLLVNWWYILRLAGRGARANGVHLLDQGCFQALWSLAYRSHVDAMLPSSAELLRLLARVSVGEMIVVTVETPPATVAARLGARTGDASRLERDVRGANGRRQLSRAEKALSVVEKLLADSEAAGRIRVLRVRGDGAQMDAQLELLLDALAPRSRAAAMV